MKRLLALAATCSLLAAHAEQPVPVPAELAVAAEVALTAATQDAALVTTPVAAEVPERSVLRDIGQGIASWYGPGLHGRRTASGERFNQHALTAAHRTLPFGTVVRVRSLLNGRTVDVRINDRGPFLKRRVIDLSKGAAAALGLLDSGSGVKPVTLTLVAPTAE